MTIRGIQSELISEEQLRHPRRTPQHTLLETQSSQLLYGNVPRIKYLDHLILCQGIGDRYATEVTSSLSRV